MTQKQLKELVEKYQPTAKETSREELSELLEAEGVEGKDLEKVLDQLYGDGANEGEESKAKKGAKPGANEGDQKEGKAKPGAKKGADHYEEWHCDFSRGKADPIRVVRPVVKITKEEAETLNNGMLTGGNKNGSYYFKTGEVPGR
jgi:hypothetical protein